MTAEIKTFNQIEPRVIDASGAIEIPKEDNFNEPEKLRWVRRGTILRWGGVAGILGATALGIAARINSAEASDPDVFLQACSTPTGAMTLNMSASEVADNFENGLDLEIEQNSRLYNSLVDNNDNIDRLGLSNLDNSPEAGNGFNKLSDGSVDFGNGVIGPSVEDAKAWLDLRDGKLDGKISLTIDEGSNVDREMQEATGTSPEDSWGITVGAGLSDRSLVYEGQVVAGNVTDEAAQAVIDAGVDVPTSEASSVGPIHNSPDHDGHSGSVSVQPEPDVGDDVSAANNGADVNSVSPFGPSRVILDTEGEASAFAPPDVFLETATTTPGSDTVPQVSPTDSDHEVATATPTNTPTDTFTPEVFLTPNASPTPIQTTYPTLTVTPVDHEATATSTATVTSTSTPEDTPTETPCPTPASTTTPENTPTTVDHETPIATETPTNTETPIAPSPTSTKGPFVKGPPTGYGETESRNTVWGFLALTAAAAATALGAAGWKLSRNSVVSNEDDEEDELISLIEGKDSKELDESEENSN